MLCHCFHFWLQYVNWRSSLLSCNFIFHSSEFLVVLKICYQSSGIVEALNVWLNSTDWLITNIVGWYVQRSYRICTWNSKTNNFVGTDYSCWSRRGCFTWWARIWSGDGSSAQVSWIRVWKYLCTGYYKFICDSCKSFHVITDLFASLYLLF